MSDSDITRYNDIKKLDTIEFYHLFDLWREELRQKREQLKQQQNGKRK